MQYYVFRTQFGQLTLGFRSQIWEFTLKKLKLGTDPHVDGSLRQILRHQFEVDNNPC